MAVYNRFSMIVAYRAIILDLSATCTGKPWVMRSVLQDVRGFWIQRRDWDIVESYLGEPDVPVVGICVKKL